MRRKAIRKVDILMGVLAAVPNFGPQTVLMIAVLQGKLEFTLKVTHVKIKYLFACWGFAEKNPAALFCKPFALHIAAGDSIMTNLTK